MIYVTMKQQKCIFLLALLSVGNGLFASASVSRSFLSRAIAPIKSFVASHPRLAKTAGIGAALVGAYALYKWWTRRELGLNRRLIQKLAGSYDTSRQQEVVKVLGESTTLPSELIGLICSYDFHYSGRVQREIFLEEPDRYGQHGSLFRGISILPDGNFLINYDLNRSGIWDGKTGRFLGESSEASQVADWFNDQFKVVFPDGHFVTKEGLQRKRTLVGKNDYVSACAVLPDGMLAVGIKQDGTLVDSSRINGVVVEIWNEQTGKCVHSFTVQSLSCIEWISQLIVLPKPDNRLLGLIHHVGGRNHGRVLIFE